MGRRTMERLLRETGTAFGTEPFGRLGGAYIAFGHATGSVRRADEISRLKEAVEEALNLGMMLLLQNRTQGKWRRRPSFRLNSMTRIYS